MEGPPSCIFSIIMFRVADNKLSLRNLSLADTPVVIKSMSIVPESLLQRNKFEVGIWK